MGKLMDKIKIIKENIRADERLIKKLILANVVACTVFTTSMSISAFGFINQTEKHIELQKQKEIETGQALDGEIAKTKDRVIATAIATHITSALTFGTFYPALRLTFDYKNLQEQQETFEKNRFYDYEI